MVTKQTPKQREKAKLIKAVRAVITLKYRLRADDELNEVLPEIEKKIDKAIASGEVFELPIASLLEEDA